MDPKSIGRFNHSYTWKIVGYSLVPARAPELFADNIIDTAPPDVAKSAWSEMKILLAKVMS